MLRRTKLVTGAAALGVGACAAYALGASRLQAAPSEERQAYRDNAGRIHMLTPEQAQQVGSRWQYTLLPTGCCII